MDGTGRHCQFRFIDRRHPLANLSAAAQSSARLLCRYNGLVILTGQFGEIAVFCELGLFDAASLTASLALAVFVPMGLALGVWLNRAMNDALFYHISHGFLLVLGLKFILQANI